MKAVDVFTPGSFPQHTYVSRDGAKYEQTLRDALATPGLLVSLNGPSKSGKTVLVEKVVGSSGLISLVGTGIKEPEDVWARAMDVLGLPREEVTSTTVTAGGSISASAGVSAGLLGLVGGKVGGGGSAKLEGTRGVSVTRQKNYLQEIVNNIANSDFVVLVDDFHYMDKPVQIEVAKALKEGVRLGIKICTASAIHRADDIVRANPELRGRVHALDLKYWSRNDLKEIADQGFSKLKLLLPDKIIEKFIIESAGSPQLMQSICLQACFHLDVRESLKELQYLEVTESQLKSIFEQVTATTDFRSLVDVLDAGPKLRGTERKIYNFINDTKGDVYRCVLGALAMDPPQLSFGYEEITQRTRSFCQGEYPVGSSVTGSCQHMDRLAKEKFPNDMAIDWDEQKQVFDIPNPYFLFYLRWSNRIFED